MSLVVTTARARVRAELTEEIKTVARRHLAEHGASGLSLRAVTREVGLTPRTLKRVACEQTLSWTVRSLGQG